MLYFSFYSRWFNRNHLSQFIPGHCLPQYRLCSSTFQYVMWMGAVFTIIGGFVHWFPITSGYTLNMSKNSLHNFICSRKYDSFFPCSTFLAFQGCHFTPATLKHTQEIFHSFISLTAVMLIIFKFWDVFASKWEVSEEELTTTNPEWLHECPLPYSILEDHTYVNLK